MKTSSPRSNILGLLIKETCHSDQILCPFLLYTDLLSVLICYCYILAILLSSLYQVPAVVVNLRWILNWTLSLFHGGKLFSFWDPFHKVISNQLWIEDNLLTWTAVKTMWLIAGVKTWMGKKYISTSKTSLTIVWMLDESNDPN